MGMSPLRKGKIFMILTKEQIQEIVHKTTYVHTEWPVTVNTMIRELCESHEDLRRLVIYLTDTYKDYRYGDEKYYGDAFIKKEVTDKEVDEDIENFLKKG